jgi:GGDEF domain-containing protein
MRSVCEGSREPAELLEQIARLQADVARLEQKVRESDHLAHFDALIPIPNRRGMLRELKTMIARREPTTPPPRSYSSTWTGSRC